MKTPMKQMALGMGVAALGGVASQTINEWAGLVTAFGGMVYVCAQAAVLVINALNKRKTEKRQMKLPLHEKR